MKHNEEFADFLRDHVNLNQTRIDQLEEHISAVTGYLKNNHDGFRKTDKQGSHALGTIIKPVKEDDEYDADLLAIVEKTAISLRPMLTGYTKRCKRVTATGTKLKSGTVA